MNLTIKEARYLVTGLKELLNNVEIMIEVYAPYGKKEELAAIIEKLSEGLYKLHSELANSICRIENKTQVDFNFEDYL
jgi:hypothetical protein